MKKYYTNTDFMRKAYEPVRSFTSDLKNTATNTLMKLKTSRDYDESEDKEEACQGLKNMRFFVLLELSLLLQFFNFLLHWQLWATSTGRLMELHQVGIIK